MSLSGSSLVSSSRCVCTNSTVQRGRTILVIWSDSFCLGHCRQYCHWVGGGCFGPYTVVDEDSIKHHLEHMDLLVTLSSCDQSAWQKEAEGRKACFDSWFQSIVAGKARQCSQQQSKCQGLLVWSSEKQRVERGQIQR